MSDRNALALELAGTPAMSRRDALAEELAASWNEAVQAQQQLTPARVGTDPDAPTPSGYKAVGGMALVTGGTMGGAALGAMTGPFAPVAVPVLGAAGAELGNITSKYLGWQPGQWNEPDLSDALAVGVPLVVGGGTALARAALPYTRAGRAVQVAKDATAAQKAAYAARLVEEETAHTEAIAQAQAARPPWQRQFVQEPPVPQTLQSLRSGPPTPVAPAPITMPSRGRLLNELGVGSLVTPAVGTTIAVADGTEALVSKALMSPLVRPWFLRQLEASGGTLTPQTLATLSTVMRGAALPAEGSP